MRDIFFIFLALLATCWGYSFGQSDHLEHLPVLYRLLDENYLLNDNFVNENMSGYNPRRLFFILLLPFCKLLGIELVYFIGCWLINYLIARVTYALTNELFATSDNNRAGLWAVLFVLTLSVVGLGESAYRRAEFFVPSAAGSVIVMYAIYWGVKEQYLRLGIILGLGAFIHPLLCPLSGGMWFACLGINHFYRYQFHWAAYKRLFGAGLIWLIISVGVIAPYYYENFAADKLAGREFALIYAHFRCPHHFLPSFFWERERNVALAWLALFILWLIKVYRNQIAGKRELFLLASLSGMVLLLLPFGYYLVEVYPTRLWATIQVFRFLFIVKWLVLVFAVQGMRYAGKNMLVNDELRSTSNTANRTEQTAQQILHYLLLLDPLRLLAFELFLLIFGGWKYANYAVYLFLGWSIYSIYPQLGENADIYLFLGAFLASAGFIIHYKTQPKLYLSVFLTLIGVFLTYYMLTPRQVGDNFLKKACSHQFTIAQIPSDKQKIAAFIANNSPNTARFLCPPNFSELRLTAKRSIIIDFKTFPFEDRALKRWHTDIMDIYGYTDKLGFEAVRWAFEPNYLYSTETQLNEKARRYGADYIILNTETATLQPILYQDSLYKLIKTF